ncbi:transport Sec31B isoform X1 [Pelobates cultripes]|uniref:Protein transport protein Sec31A n=1 Tax=Pelobates cultripes TaxID=61616 RepID=A0AAD1T944_PELCU|nr:transport Sec31B isoform X1 [Pelobates cultripes]
MGAILDVTSGDVCNKNQEDKGGIIQCGTLYNWRNKGDKRCRCRKWSDVLERYNTRIRSSWCYYTANQQVAAVPLPMALTCHSQQAAQPGQRLGVLRCSAFSLLRPAPAAVHRPSQSSRSLSPKMKLKEIERSAVQVWSPANQHPIYLATGTSAQQLDASFNTNAALEIFEVDFGDPNADLTRRGFYPASSRFHKLIWGSYGSDTVGSLGVIVGGGDNGTITLYSASQILESGKDPVIAKNDKHSGPIRALDFNPFQSNLLASGANDSEVFIWDLNNFTVPMTPGAKSQPMEDISAVSWNRQVQHILSSAHPSGKAVVWDLRKNEPVIKVSDHSNRMHCSGMMWHPEIPTQLILSSEDDRLPVIQVWDLRFASSPLKMLENHTRGILSVSWSNDDPELLLSSAKDNRILCWNPSTSEVVYELPTKNQWCFDVQWCPRNPSVFSAASFDGWVSIYSVMGGNLEAQQRSQADRISSSFNSMDPFGTGQPLPPLQVAQQVSQTTVIPPLKKPPRWIRRPVGVCFAFGGKLVSFDYPKVPIQPTQEPTQHKVYISQVTTESEILVRSSELQAALISGNLLSYCQNKVQSSPQGFDKNVWNFLKVNFEQDAREKFIKLLGYNKEELDRKISKALGESWQNKSSPSEAEDLVHSIQSVSSQASSSFTGQLGSSSSSMEFFNLPPPDTAKFDIPVTADTDGLISQALLLGNFESAVDLCLKDGRFADAIILANAGGEDLLRETQQWYFSHQKNKITSLLSFVVQQKWRDIVLNCSLQSWKEALALLLTYSKPEEFSELCDALGNRLESEGEGKLSSQACLCYISSGNVDKLTECWVKSHDTSSPLALQDLIEKVMVLRKSIELLQGTQLPLQGPVLSEKVAQYANLLASQGDLTAAMSYLSQDSGESSIRQLRERLLNAQGEVVPAQSSTTRMPGTQPSPTAKPSKAPDGLSYRESSKQALSQLSAGTGIPSHPPVPSIFTPQPMPTQVGPPPSAIPFQTVPGQPPNAYSRPGAMQPYSAPQPPTRAFAQPPPFKPVHQVPPSTAFPPSPVLGQIPMNVPTATNPSGPRFYPPSSIPSLHTSTSYSSVRAPTSMGQPPTPPSMNSAQVPFNYPMGPGAPTNLPPPPTGCFHWLENCPASEAIEQEGWTESRSFHATVQRKKSNPFIPLAPITTPVMNLPSEAESLQNQWDSNLDSGQPHMGAPKEATVQGIQRLPVERIEKKELPLAHQPLQKTFDGLVQRCSAVPSDPKTKRKLEDASQKLEFLYDKLRENALSPHILMGLHEIAHCVDTHNYQHGLIVHTQVVSSSSFSEVSGFMPILKVLMTIANKLNV